MRRPCGAGFANGYLVTPETASIIRRRRDTVLRLKTILIESLDLDLSEDEIDEDEPLFGLGMGLDSIDALQLVLGVEAAYDMTLPPDDLMIYRSINTMADFITQAEADTNGATA